MWRREECAEDNHKLLTLVHGVDRKGRPVIKAFTGNARHPVYQGYEGIINKNYEKAARLAEFSRNVESPPYGMSNSCYSESCSSSTRTPRTRASTTRWTPSLSAGARSPTTVPELKGMRAMISRLRCSLAIHAGLGQTNKEVNFLPVIPVRVRKPPSAVCPKKGCAKAKSVLKKQDLESDSSKGNRTSQTNDVEQCKEDNLGTFSQITKAKKRKKKKASCAKKLKPKLKPIADIVPLNSISSKYLLS